MVYTLVILVLVETEEPRVTLPLPEFVASLAMQPNEIKPSSLVGNPPGFSRKKCFSRDLRIQTYLLCLPDKF